MSTISWFESIENKHDVYRSKDCMKNCHFLREYTMEAINFKKKKWAAGIIWKCKICYICKEKVEIIERIEYVKDKKDPKVRDHCHYREEYRGAENSKCNLKYSVPKKFLLIFIMDLAMIIILS